MQTPDPQNPFFLKFFKSFFIAGGHPGMRGDAVGEFDVSQIVRAERIAQFR